jgi:hypothetical protein
MFFKVINRYNPKTGNRENYYSLVESYRNALGEPSHRMLLSLGYAIDNELPFHEISDRLNEMVSGKQNLFPLDEKAERFTQQLYYRLINEKKIDVLEELRRSAGDWETVDLKTLRNEDVRELGAEWMSLQALKELEIDDFLRTRGWDEDNVQLAMSHIVSRAVYPASELKTARFMVENSSICELTGYPVRQITKDKLYAISKKLYHEKSCLEKHLSKKTNELFDLEDKIILYDLTNTYYEGSKRGSQLARFGRSKEKRNDCPLIVLALVVNIEGFIKYSTIFEGNLTDCKSLGSIIEHLRTDTSENENRAIVVMDAGIATAENLELLKSKGYDYVCVCRSNLKKYREVTTTPVQVRDNRGREITLREVEVEGGDSEYYLKVESPLKALKESSMNTLFHQRFEEGLKNIAESIHKKSGVKNYGKVCERIGRLKAKYPSASKLYSIEILRERNEEEKSQKKQDNCCQIHWSLIAEAFVEKRKEQGIYFLKTSLKKAGSNVEQERLIWTIYNSIRNIESSFRTLKTDLDLRPIYHKTDGAGEAHLHLGLLAYWLVNTVRYKLKQNNIHSLWSEIVRVMNTQKVVTTCVENDKKQLIRIRKCSEPSDKVKLFYNALGYKYAPFVRKKSVVNISEYRNEHSSDLVRYRSG